MDNRFGSQPEQLGKVDYDAEINNSGVVENNQLLNNARNLKNDVSGVSARGNIDQGSTELSDSSIEVNNIEGENDQKEDVTRKVVDYDKVKNMVFGSPQSSDFNSYAESFNKLVY